MLVLSERAHAFADTTSEFIKNPLEGELEGATPAAVYNATTVILPLLLVLLVMLHYRKKF